MAEKTRYDYRVEPQNVDCTLHSTMESLGNYLLNTAGDDAQSKGFGVDVLGPKNRLWVLMRMAMEFDNRPEQYSRFGVNTWVSENNRIVSTRNFEVIDGCGNVFGRSVSQWCLIDSVRRTPVSLEELYDLNRDMLCTEPEPCPSPRKLLSCDHDGSSIHKVVYSDIDFNGHVNTMRYITMMTDLLPLEVHRQNRPFRLDVNFLHECLYGDELSISYSMDCDLASFEIRNGSGVTAVRATIEWK